MSLRWKCCSLALLLIAIRNAVAHCVARLCASSIHLIIPLLYSFCKYSSEANCLFFNILARICNMVCSGPMCIHLLDHYLCVCVPIDLFIHLIVLFNKRSAALYPFHLMSFSVRDPIRLLSIFPAFSFPTFSFCMKVFSSLLGRWFGHTLLL